MIGESGQEMETQAETRSQMALCSPEGTQLSKPCLPARSHTSLDPLRGLATACPYPGSLCLPLPPSRCSSPLSLPNTVILMGFHSAPNVNGRCILQIRAPHPSQNTTQTEHDSWSEAPRLSHHYTMGWSELRKS